MEEWATITSEQCVRLVSPTGGVLKLSLPTKTFVRSIKSISVSVFNTFSLLFHRSILLHNLISELICMYGLLGLLPTSDEHVMSTAPLEIYLLRKNSDQCYHNSVQYLFYPLYLLFAALFANKDVLFMSYWIICLSPQI